MKKLLFIGLLFLSTNLFAQSSKYIVVESLNNERRFNFFLVHGLKDLPIVGGMQLKYSSLFNYLCIIRLFHSKNQTKVEIPFLPLQKQQQIKKNKEN